MTMGNLGSHNQASLNTLSAPYNMLNHHMQSGSDLNDKVLNLYVPNGAQRNEYPLGSQDNTLESGQHFEAQH